MRPAALSRLTKTVLRRVTRGLLRALFRVQLRGLEHLRAAPPGALVVANHVSFLDAVLLIAFLDEGAVFAINRQVAGWWWVRPFLRLVETVTIDPANPFTAKVLVARLQAGARCVVFPEGRITVTGSLMKLYAGPAFIADRARVPVIPVRIDGAELTYFSRLERGQVRRRWLPRIRITVGAPARLTVDDALRGRARRRRALLEIYDLMSGLVYRTDAHGPTLFAALRQARRRSGGRFVAVEDHTGARLSHDRLLLAALALGRRLTRLTRPGEAVGLLLPNTAATAVVFFALQAIGRVPAMLNHAGGAGPAVDALATARIETVIAARAFVEQARLQPLAARLAENARMLWAEDLRATITRRDRVWAWFATRFGRGGGGDDGADPAAILFTSGSEGRPKGVVLSHANLLANCAQVAARIDVSRLDRCLASLPLFHSFGLTAAFLLPLLRGAGVLFYPTPIHYRAVPEAAYTGNATVLFGTDTFLHGYARMADPYDFRSLRYAFAGAEPLRDETRSLWFETFGVRVLEGYGATETGPVLAMNTPMHHRPSTVGRFLPGIEWRLAAVEGLAEGGRLWVRGANVMLGYLRFENPGRLQPPSEGWYDTGDLVRVDMEGFVTVIGRAKRFAKVAGEMISLGAVEDAIEAAAPGARHALVALPDPRRGERLVLVTTDPGMVRERVLAAIRARGLSELCLPERIVHIAALPLLGSGKTDYPAVMRRLAGDDAPG